METWRLVSMGIWVLCSTGIMVKQCDTIEKLTDKVTKLQIEKLTKELKKGESK